MTREITLNTRGECDIIDITPDIEQELARAGVANGIVTIFIAGSTAGLTTIEFESGVLADLQDMWQRIVPKDIAYAHDRRWGDGNGYSHVRASLQGASLTVPFSNKRLVVGTWQQIVLIDFDNRPRSRRVILQIMGE
ncbi:MAG: secondary thiamine-phosphate synthase enzyme YjbQ [Dehalococcoidales bacterium]|nr:secondary thiamine-phosphate synthase enzyme YjbQ [Dehalococcoidales bacterium]